MDFGRSSRRRRQSPVTRSRSWSRAASASARPPWSARSARSGRCAPRSASPRRAARSTTSPAWSARAPPRSRWTSAASPSATASCSTCSARPGRTGSGSCGTSWRSGALGAVVLADTRRLADCFPAVDYFERRSIPFIVAVNCFDGRAAVHSSTRCRPRSTWSRAYAGAAVRRARARVRQGGPDRARPARDGDTKGTRGHRLTRPVTARPALTCAGASP